jgi:peptidoglycan/xylan/chitin deacetylase (PgdA/CDA1 family)
MSDDTDPHPRQAISPRVPPLLALRRRLADALSAPRSGFLASLRARAFRRRLAAARTGIVILCYHEVQPDEQASLDRQLDLIGRRARFVDMATVHDCVARGRPLRELMVAVTMDDGYRNCTLAILPVLKAHDIRATAFVIGARLAGGLLSDRMPTPEGQNKLYLSAAELAEWQRAGMDVGSHSQTHRRLSTLSPEDIVWELDTSRRKLEAAAGVAVTDFAVPWGLPGLDFDVPSLTEMARAAGYRTVSTTRRGVADAGSDPYCLPRLVAEPDWPLT